jgi:hypothetical protein
MLSLLWLFVGALVGLLIVSVFEPSARPEMKVPLPHDKSVMRTQTGCIKFTTTEVPCPSNATSLASQYK